MTRDVGDLREVAGGCSFDLVQDGVVLFAPGIVGAAMGIDYDVVDKDSEGTFKRAGRVDATFLRSSREGVG